VKHRRPTGWFDNGTLSQRVRDYLRDQILSNHLSPGMHLQEEVIASSLGISRAPVRDALRLLAAEDLVTIRPRRGAVVKALSRADFLAGYQVREALEALAVRLAVPRLTPDDLRILAALHARMRAHARRGQVDEYFQRNADFHTLFVERSGNPWLQAIYAQVMNQLRRYRVPSLHLRGGLERSLAEHAAILAAVRRGDAEAASRLVREHIQVPQRILQAASESEVIQASPPRRVRSVWLSATGGRTAVREAAVRQSAALATTERRR
jgi:DNA-binding GntR family transcriptional regulator